MSLIKWLEVGKDIKLGKIRTEIKKGDIIVIKDLSGSVNRYMEKRFLEQLHKVFPDNLIISLSGEVTLEKLNEKEMNRAGWIRK